MNKQSFKKSIVALTAGVFIACGLIAPLVGSSTADAHHSRHGGQYCDQDDCPYYGGHNRDRGGCRY